jgi:DNA invertase Pin-like site-specific DNA recombinase
MPKQQNRIAFYLRSATGNMADLSRQRKCLERDLISRFDSTDYSLEIYTETHQSGLRSGPEFERMCRDVVSRKINVIIVERYDRISRKLDNLLRFNKFVDANRTRFISTDENVDSIHRQSAQYGESFGGMQ